MSEVIEIIHLLKKTLRREGVTYFDIASHLNLSEASIKKMFAENKISLMRLGKICQLVNMDISDLILELGKEPKGLIALTYEQEKEIVSDLSLLIVAVSILSGFSLKDILKKYQISEKQCLGYFTRLEKLGLIKLYSDNRYKLTVRKTFSWINGGPIQSYFHDHLQKEFFRSNFDQENEKLILASGVLSLTSSQSLVRKVEKLALDFGRLDDEDKDVPYKDKNGCTMVLAFRQWQPESFRALMKNKQKTG